MKREAIDILADFTKFPADLVACLDASGFVIVKKEPPHYFHGHARAGYRMNISVGQATDSVVAPISKD